MFQVMLDNFRQIEADMDPKDFVYYEEYLRSGVCFSNLDMAFVQSAFFAPIVALPHVFGLGSVYLYQRTYFLPHEFNSIKKV